MSKTMITITGDKQLERELLALTASSARTIMRPALSAAATIVNKEAKNNVAIETGATKKAIGKKVGKARDGGVNAKIYIRPGHDVQKNKKKHNPVKTAHLLEFGTKHAAPKPFLRPALANKRDEVKAKIKSVAKNQLYKQTGKLKFK